MRVLNMTLDTLRVLFVMRGRKKTAWGLGFVQSVIFILVFNSVLANLDNPIYIVAYAAGFATGNVAGMWIEERLAIGYVRLQVVSPLRGVKMAERLRDEGFAVTEVSARGKDGMVSLLSCAVLRKRVALAESIIRDVDDAAFITVEEMRAVRRGFWRR
jgi:uncharacterized protein YebE (UPF0316 family)